MTAGETDTCEECDHPIRQDYDEEAGERPRSRWYDDLCIVCGIEQVSDDLEQRVQQLRSTDSPETPFEDEDSLDE